MKILLVLFVICVNLFSYEDVKVELVSVYDGDTFKVNIKNYPKIIGEKINIRINGIDTPELRAKCEREKFYAVLAKNYTKKILLNAENIELKNIKRGKYFRIVGDVFVDGVLLSDMLLEKGYAVVYDGKKKYNSWCK
jgi:endonuclease YncB( thermonuclease family)